MTTTATAPEHTQAKIVAQTTPHSTMTMAKALNAGLRRALADDPKTILMGEDIGQLGGVFRITDNLQHEFGPHRVIDTPLAESGIVGTAIGLALGGYRPCVEIQFDGFVFPAFNQIVTQASRFSHRTHGQLHVPLVIRIPFGGNIGAIEHHSESPEALFSHIPGLKIVAPSTPDDAYWLIQDAIQDPNPVLFFEPKRRYQERGSINLSRRPTSGATIRRTGTQVTLVAYGPMLATALAAAEIAQTEGISIEVIDLVQLAPLDDRIILDSVRKTGRCIIAHEATRTGGIGAELAARVTQSCFFEMEAPPLRVTAPDQPYPPAKVEGEYLPDVDRILTAVDHALGDY